MKNKPVLKRTFISLTGQKATLILSLGCAVVSGVSSVIATLYLGKCIDSIIGKNQVDFTGLYKNVVVLALLFMAAAMFQWLVSVLSNKVAFDTAMFFRKQLFGKLNNLPVEYFDTNFHGDTLSRFTNDLDNMSDALALTLSNLFVGGAVICSALWVMLRLNVKITIVVLLCTPVCFITAYLTAKFSRNTFKRQQATVGQLSGYISEYVGNEKTVKALGVEQESVKSFKKINQELLEVGTRAQFASAIVNPVTRFADHTAYILAGVVGAFAAIAGGVSPGVISSFLIFSSQFAKPFNEISGIINQLQIGYASLNRIYTMLDEIDEPGDNPEAVELKQVKGAIEFNKVDFSYDKSRPLIQNLSLSAPPGSLIAIVGPTGAGKTTIVNLLMRFYDIDQGDILIDNHSIHILKKDSIRRRFGMVLQETWLFSGTVRDNILFGNPEASEEEMITAAKFAHAHSFIKNLSHGYDTQIIKSGDNLSEGQKQLITIARVMLAKPEMLILDEATSSIDTLTERRVQRAFQKMMEGRTSFVIAHRLSTIQMADTILVLDQGNIVEMGTHEVLLEKKGFYASLYESQFK